MTADQWPTIEPSLALRIELAEAHEARAFAEARGALGGFTTASLQVGGGVAVFAGADSSRSRLIGAGLSEQVSDRELDAMEAFFRAHRVPAVVDVASLAEPTLVPRLSQRGFLLKGVTHVWTCPVQATVDRAHASDVDVTPVGPSEAERWCNTVMAGFAETDTVAPEASALGLPLFRLPSVTCFLARAKGAPAGGAATSTSEGLVTLFAMSTLPSMRGRGVQGALIRAALAHAAQQGADLAAAATEPLGASQRNFQRAGFRLAYPKLELVKPL